MRSSSSSWTGSERVSWYQRQRRTERVEDYRAKRKQKNLLAAAGVLGVAGGLARAPWAAKHAVRAAGKVSPRVGRGVARVPGRARLAAVERQATSASTPLAIASGATGSLSSLTYAGRLKRETQKEGKKLGIEKASLAEIRKRASEPQVGAVARRRARDARDESWRAQVSAGAQGAHDRALPPYKQRHQRRAMTGAGTAALGVGAAGLGGRVALRNVIRATKAKGRLAPIAAGTALTAGGLGAAGVGTGVAVQGVRRAHGITQKQRAIRGRGHQRALDAVR